MASGAGLSTAFGTPVAEAHAGGHGRNPMQATPVTKRGGVGSSPTKRAVRRVAAEATSQEVVPQVDHPTLVVEVHKLYQQSKKDQEVFNALTEATDQHAARIDDFKADTDLFKSDLMTVAADVLRNDTELKENLRKLEELVTEQGIRDNELKEKLKKLEEMVIGQGKAIHAGSGNQGDTVTAERHVNDMNALDLKMSSNRCGEHPNDGDTFEPDHHGRWHPMAVRDVGANDAGTNVAAMADSPTESTNGSSIVNATTTRSSVFLHAARPTNGKHRRRLSVMARRHMRSRDQGFIPKRRCPEHSNSRRKCPSSQDTNCRSTSTTATGTRTGVFSTTKSRWPM